MAPQVGFEPTTLRLTAECSTIELLRSVCSGQPHYTKFIASLSIALQAHRSIGKDWRAFRHPHRRDVRGVFFGRSGTTVEFAQSTSQGSFKRGRSLSSGLAAVSLASVSALAAVDGGEENPLVRYVTHLFPASARRR